MTEEKLHTTDHHNGEHAEHVSLSAPVIGLSFAFLGFGLLVFSQKNFGFSFLLLGLFFAAIVGFSIYEIRKRKAHPEIEDVEMETIEFKQDPLFGFMGKKLWIWGFLISEVIFFTLLIGFSFALRLAVDESLGFKEIAEFCGLPYNSELFGLYPVGWTDGYGHGPKDILDIPLTTVNTFVLICSSYTMVKAHEAAENKDFLGSRGARNWLLATIAIGSIFLGIQVYEYAELINEGFTMASGLFGATFFLQTGFHGAHVFGGIVLLSFMAYKIHIGAMRDPTDIEIAGLYWHFIDVVWIMLFTLVYLI